MMRTLLTTTALLGGVLLAPHAYADAASAAKNVATGSPTVSTGAPTPVLTKTPTPVVTGTPIHTSVTGDPCEEPCSEATAKTVSEAVLPQLKFAGQTSFNNWVFNNNVKTIYGDPSNDGWVRIGNGRSQYFSMDNSRLHLSVDGKTDLGLEYGLHFTFNGDVGASKTMRENYIYFAGSWGKIYLGDTYGVQDTMTFGSWDQWGGTGFINGPMVSHVLTTTTGALVSDDLVGDTSRATKATYITPRWKGFQLGVSYTPRGDHIGGERPNSLLSADTPKVPFDTDNFTNTVNFMHQFASGVELSLAGNYIFAQVHPEYPDNPVYDLKRHKVASFFFGGTVSYEGVGFSMDYGNNGKSRQFMIGGKEGANAGQWLSFGLSYTQGATKLSTGYYYSWRNALGGGVTSDFKRKKATTNAVSAAIDHKLAPGLALYAEYANFQLRNPAATDEANRLNTFLGTGSKQYVGPVKSNKANALVIGSRLVF